MLEQEIAAIVHLIKPLELQEYFGEIPQDIQTPAIYYPVPEVSGNEFSLNSYENSFSLFVKVFDKDSMSSYSIASWIVEQVQSKGKKIPLYDKNGDLLTKNFHVSKVNAKNIDVGVTQIEFTWNIQKPYDRSQATSSNNIYFDGLATSVKEEKDG